MGDTDRFVAGILLGGPAALIAAAVILLWSTNSLWQRMPLVLTLLATPIVLYLYLPLAISTGLRGHHLCGAEFDEYLSAVYWWERFIPVVHVVLASTLFLGAMRSVVRGWRAAQPGVESDGRLRGRG